MARAGRHALAARGVVLRERWDSARVLRFVVGSGAGAARAVFRQGEGACALRGCFRVPR